MPSIIYCLDCGYPMGYSQADLTGSVLQHETADGKIHKNTGIINSDDLEFKGTDNIDAIREVIASYLQRDVATIPSKPMQDSESVPVTKKDIVKP